MKIEVHAQDLQDILEENQARHEKLYTEAVEGYLDAARKRLEDYLGQLRDGKVRSVAVHLEAPRNHVPEYETVIGMLRLHAGDKIELTADEYRMFVEDEWDWMSSWLVNNALYSAGTRAYAAEKNMDISSPPDHY